MLNATRFSQAVKLAAKLHAKQKRKGTEVPYLSHLLQVSGLVLEHGGDEDEAIGGLLHDAAEDAGGEPTLQAIRDKFGPNVEDIVRQNSDSITPSKGKKAPWRKRKKAYLASVAHKSPSALLVSVCDKLHNARGLVQDTRHIGPSHWKRFNATRKQTLWYQRSLLEAFEARIVDEPRLKVPLAELRDLVDWLDAH